MNRKRAFSGALPVAILVLTALGFTGCLCLPDSTATSSGSSSVIVPSPATTPVAASPGAQVPVTTTTTLAPVARAAELPEAAVPAPASPPSSETVPEVATPAVTGPAVSTPVVAGPEVSEPAMTVPAVPVPIVPAPVEPAPVVVTPEASGSAVPPPVLVPSEATTPVVPEPVGTVSPQAVSEVAPPVVTSPAGPAPTDVSPRAETSSGNSSGPLSGPLAGLPANDASLTVPEASLPSLNPVFPRIMPSTSSFSPDGDGEDDLITFRIDEPRRSDVEAWSFTVREPEGSDTGSGSPSRVFKQWKGVGEPPQSIVWDGIGVSGEKVESAVEYPYLYESTYKTGEQSSASSVLPVDVLLEKDGDRYKIRVASIVFRPDGADFARLSPEIVLRNETTLKRVASILARYPDYAVVVEGHANSIAKIQGLSAEKVALEEKAELLPLSLARASFVRDRLIAQGIAPSRLKVAGLGSSIPVFPFSDAARRWKNRRVEFILQR